MNILQRFVALCISHSNKNVNIDINTGVTAERTLNVYNLPPACFGPSGPSLLKVKSV